MRCSLSMGALILESGDTSLPLESYTIPQKTRFANQKLDASAGFFCGFSKGLFSPVPFDKPHNEAKSGRE
jgi:hypothetical protein